MKESEEGLERQSILKVCDGGEENRVKHLLDTREPFALAAPSA